MRHHPVFAFIAAAALVATVGCQSQGNAKETAEEAAQAALVPVEIATLARGPIEQVLRFSTHLEAERAVEVRAEAARKVVALTVEEGTQVARGQVLLRLEDDQQRTALARASSQLEKAALEHDRQSRLYAEKMLSEQEMTRVAYERQQLELAVADARRELSYTTVRAPIAGTVTRRHVRVGDQVSVNQHLFDMVDFDSLVALVYVPERELPRLGVGQQVRLTPPAAPGTLFGGRVDRVAPVVDPKSGTVKVTVAVPNREGLRPGMFLEVELVTAIESAALLLPKRAVVPDGTQLAVWRLKADDTVERLWITPQHEDHERFSVTSGLAVGDRVVVAGQAGLKVGAKAQVIGGGDVER